MRLSFILPVLDEVAGLLDTLVPLQPLRRQGHEVILVDGGSRDGTPALAAPWVDRVLAAPRGRARQMNAGAAQAGGESLVFLHADTRLPEDAAPLIQAALRERLWGRFDVRIRGRLRLLKLVARLMNLRSRLTGIATGDQVFFVRREVFSALGGFPDQPLMEDIELSKRLKRRGPPACLRQRVLTSGRRWESQGAWRTIFLMWRLRFDYWRGVPVEALAARYCLAAQTACQHRGTPDQARIFDRGRLQARILIFAKAPVPGRVKTRLIPALGAEGAAALASHLLFHALAQALEADLGPVELCASPAPDHPDWRPWLPALRQWGPRLGWSDQGEGDLGARMARPAMGYLAAGERVLLMGTDCPALSCQHLRQAATMLDEHQAALIPARDGGYVLLGLRTFHPSLFTAMPWSSPDVTNLTLERLGHLNWRVWVGEALADIDVPADLDLLSR